MTVVLLYDKLIERLTKCDSEIDFTQLFDDVLCLEDRELLRFLLKTGCYKFGREKVTGKVIETKRPDYFWKSEVPLTKKDLLFKGNFVSEFLYGYFGFEPNARPEITEAVCKVNSDLFIRNCKLSQAFLKRPFYNSLKILRQSSNSALNVFFKEISFLYRINSDWEVKQEHYRGKLSGFSIDEILVHIVSYHEKFKRASDKVSNNRPELVSHEVHLCYSFSEMLADYKTIAGGNKLVSELDATQFESLLQRTLPPINPPEGLAHGVYLPVEEMDPTKLVIRDCVEFYFTKRTYRNNLDKYCSGMADVYFLDQDQATFHTNDRYANYTRNDTKNKYTENYYGNVARLEYLDDLASVDSLAWERQEVLDTCRQHFKTLAIITLESKISQQNLVQAVELLTDFSKWIMPQGRHIFCEPVENKREGIIVQPITFRKEVPQEFLAQFKPDYLVRFTNDELVENLRNYFKWDTAEIKLIVDFLTYDLNEVYNYPVEFICQPLIRAGNFYYWMSSLLRDRHWANLVHTRLVKGKLLDSKAQAAQMESNIYTWFAGAGFASEPSLKYGHENGEIDTLAYKDGHLIFVELKTTYISEDLLREHQYDSDILEIRAAEQLNRAMIFFQNNFEYFSKREALKIDRPLEEIQMHGLIVSNSFEADGTYKSGKHLKVSLLELEVILKNRLFYLYNIPIPGFLLQQKEAEYVELDTLMGIENQNNFRFKNTGKAKMEKEDCNLWKSANLTFERFNEILRDNEVWRHMDRSWQSNVREEYTISRYDPKLRWLE
jgi:hypothetical protein